MNNIVASLDNPQTVSELKQTAANAAQLTAKIDAVGGDVAQLTSDPEFMKGVRNLTIGLGELFGEIYPAKPLNRHEIGADIGVISTRYRADVQMVLMASIATAAIA